MATVAADTAMIADLVHPEAGLVPQVEIANRADFDFPFVACRTFLAAPLALAGVWQRPSHFEGVGILAPVEDNAPTSHVVKLRELVLAAS